jgi:cytochrome c553
MKTTAPTRIANAAVRARSAQPVVLTLGASLLGASLLGASTAGCRANLLSMGSGAMSDAGPMSDAVVVPEEVDPVAFFEDEVESTLVLRCGGCHGAGRSAPDFLRPDPDVRTTLLAYPALIDLESPRTSRLLVKGEHAGPALRSAEAAAVLTWLEAEAEAGTMVDTTEREIATAPVEVREGFNNIPLDSLGMPASSIHFVASRVGDGLFLDSVQLAAGPMGARVEHPVFVTWIDTAPHPDPVDRFAELMVEVEPNRSATFDSGTVVITDYPDGALLSIHFDAAGPLMGGTMPGVRDAGVGDAGADAGGGASPEGCSQLEAFRENAVPELRTYCVRCHGGRNASATASMDMSDVGSLDDTEALSGCNQILGRISVDAPSASGLFTQPDPDGASGHPFAFATTGELDGFRSSILAWFEMETP